MLALLRRYRELILVAVLLVAPLGVFFAYAKEPAERSALDRAIVWLATPLEKALDWTLRTASDGWHRYLALRDAREEADQLRREVQALRVERQRFVGDRAEMERLRGLLSFAEGSPERRHVGARVVGVHLGTIGLQLLTIDRGSADGLAKAMPVVVAEGVVGRVLTTDERSAEVLVLVDRNSSIAVRVDRTRARANVRGLGKPGAAELEYALRAEDVVEGDLLVTSGTDGVFPMGLEVGRVARIEPGVHGLFHEALVAPAVDVTRVEEVLVVTSWGRPGEARPPERSPE